MGRWYKTQKYTLVVIETLDALEYIHTLDQWVQKVKEDKVFGTDQSIDRHPSIRINSLIQGQYVLKRVRIEMPDRFVYCTMKIVINALKLEE